MGNSRLILAINGFIMIILGLSFWIFPDFFTLAMFPNIEKNNEAFNVAIALRKNMGAGCVFIGTLIFWCQSSPKFVAQKLLYCCGFGFFSSCCCFTGSKVNRTGTSRSTYTYINTIYPYGINFYLCGI